MNFVFLFTNLVERGLYVNRIPFLTFPKLYKFSIAPRSGAHVNGHLKLEFLEEFHDARNTFLLVMKTKPNTLRNYLWKGVQACQLLLSNKIDFHLNENSGMGDEKFM